MSFAGSAKRMWKPVRRSSGTPKILLGVLMVVLIAVAWTLVLCWYCIFGILLVPYRLIRRHDRKAKREAMQHREMLAAVQAQQQNYSR
jgi:hypothetical protein